MKVWDINPEEGGKEEGDQRNLKEPSIKTRGRLRHFLGMSVAISTLTFGGSYLPSLLPAELLAASKKFWSICKCAHPGQGESMRSCWRAGAVLSSLALQFHVNQETLLHPASRNATQSCAGPHLGGTHGKITPPAISRFFLCFGQEPEKGDEN